ncbi:MAG: hypothetical protein ACJAXZ_001553 [Akkermansiaceae bacterium]
MEHRSFGRNSFPVWKQKKLIWKEKPQGATRRGELKADDEQVAEAIVRAGLKELGLAHRALADLPKNAPAKALLAHIITEQTSVPQKWIAQTLHMGSAPYVSKLAKEMKQAIPRSKKWRDVKQSMMRFIT